MKGVRIKVGAKVHNAIIGPKTIIERGEEINLGNDEIVLISRGGSK
jgi:ADP-glucose pyrophosphorylase